MKTVLFIQAIFIQYFSTATLSLVRRARFASAYLASGMYSILSMVLTDESRPTPLFKVYTLQHCTTATATPLMNIAEPEQSVVDGQQFAVTNCNFNSTLSRSVLSLTRIFSEDLQPMRILFSEIPALLLPHSGLRAKAIRLHEESNCNSFLRKTDPDRTDRKW